MNVSDEQVQAALTAYHRSGVEKFAPDHWESKYMRAALVAALAVPVVHRDEDERVFRVVNGEQATGEYLSMSAAWAEARRRGFEGAKFDRSVDGGKSWVRITSLDDVVPPVPAVPSGDEELDERFMVTWDTGRIGPFDRERAEAYVAKITDPECWAYDPSKEFVIVPAAPSPPVPVEDGGVIYCERCGGKHFTADHFDHYPPPLGVCGFPNCSCTENRCPDTPAEDGERDADCTCSAHGEDWRSQHCPSHGTPIQPIGDQDELRPQVQVSPNSSKDLEAGDQDELRERLACELANLEHERHGRLCETEEFYADADRVLAVLPSVRDGSALAAAVDRLDRVWADVGEPEFNAGVKYAADIVRGLLPSVEDEGADQ